MLGWIGKRSFTPSFLYKNEHKNYLVKNHLQGVFEKPIACRLILTNMLNPNEYNYYFLDSNTCRWWSLDEVTRVKEVEV